MLSRIAVSKWSCPALVCVLALSSPTAGWSQGGGTGGLGGTAVGYVESAIPASQVRVRFDAAYDANRPNRAEFFYAIGQRIGPGLPIAERKVDYQEGTLYLESLLCEGVSGFVEVPFRFLNPELNDNHAGLSDVILGGKCVLTQSDASLVSGLFRVFVPTGKSERGLGTDHYSLEGGLLGYRRHGDRAAWEGELRYWLPIDGTPGYDGSVVRYGLGFHYRAAEGCDWAVIPVAEVVGWTVLDGRSRFAQDFGQPVGDESAAGDTIVNAKLGVRVRFGSNVDTYVGYGQCLTGDRWYQNVWRLEFRWFF